MFCVAHMQGEVNTRDKRLFAAYILTAVSSIFWLVIFVKHRVTNVLLMWIHFGEPALVLLMLFANSDLNGMIADVNSLNASKYEFKKL
jgi:hypothetical protein